MLLCKITGSVVGRKAVCGFVAYNILDRFNEFFAEIDTACEELLLDIAPPLSAAVSDDFITWFLVDERGGFEKLFLVQPPASCKTGVNDRMKVALFGKVDCN